MAFSIVTGKVFTDYTGASVELPVLLTPDGPLRALIDYCLSVKRSLPWYEKLVRAMKLFLEYLEVNATKGEEEWRLFRNFSNALRKGTIDVETGFDPSGLYWAGIGTSEANKLQGQLSDFFSWLGFDESPLAAKFNPQYKGNRYDQRIDQHAYQYRRSKAFLGHAWSGLPGTDRSHLIREERLPKINSKRPPMFPEDRFEELLFKGFKVAGKYDYRGMLISLLMFGGGVRLSEAFQLYTADIQPHWNNDSIAFVAIHHPSLGHAPNHWKNQKGQRGQRQEYLATNFGLHPRNVIRGKLRAGWKHPALDDKWYMQVYWFPEWYGQWFLELWGYYLEQVIAIERAHPFAWVNLTGEPIGGIYSCSEYQKSLQRAVERIGLPYGKEYGTSAHGFRHAYAQRARRAGIDPVITQRIMHHCSPESQLVYTQPEVHEAMTAIRNATKSLQLAHASTSLNLENQKIMGD